MYTKTFEQLSKKDTAIAGGKGASLGEMLNAGILVPPGFVILAGAFEKFLEETDLAQEITAQLKRVDYNEVSSVDEASNVIRDLIHDAEMPKDLQKEFTDAYLTLIPSSYGEGGFVAVRSSATAEDSSVASWAGELESYLNTDKNNLLENIKKCWSSLFTPRAIFYRKEKKLLETHVSVAVVVQKMIQSEVSGICFTVHPVTEDRNQMVIEAGWGLGEAIVGGLITPDSFVIDKKASKIMDKNISRQEMMIVREKNKTKEVMVAKAKQEKQKLSDKEILELAEICQKIENHYGFPCDIEWAYEKKKFYIVQSRPITTLAMQSFIRKFQKFFSRELSLATIEYWHKAEFSELLKLLKGATHFNPLFILNKNGLVDIYYDMNNPDTATQPLFDYFDKNSKAFNKLAREFQKYQEKISYLINNFKPNSFQALFDNMTRAFGYLPIWVELASVESSVYKKYSKRAYELRDKFQEIEYKVDKVLYLAIKKKYPKLKDYAQVISVAEVINDEVPNLRKLKERSEGLIYFEGQVLTGISKNEFAQKYQIEFNDSFATIGEDNSKKIVAIKNNKDEDVNIVKGKIAYHGLAKGKVRIILLKDKIGTIQKGEVLVTVMTTPDFLLAIKKAAAFITDEGGITSHAAIVAREMKKPCIIGTKIATQVLHDGDLVEVDAEKGVVRILKRAKK